MLEDDRHGEKSVGNSKILPSGGHLLIKRNVRFVRAVTTVFRKIECLVPRSLAGNTGPWPRDLKSSGDRPKLTPNRRPQVRDCGPPRDSQEGSSRVQRDTRSSEAREKTIHHREHRGLIVFFNQSAVAIALGSDSENLCTLPRQHGPRVPRTGAPLQWQPVCASVGASHGRCALA